jgi:hypothetical protein
VTDVHDAYRQAAAAYLRELLQRPGRYRRRWEQYAERSRAGQINRLAVAEVLARHRWSHPRAKGDNDVLPRQLKDTVLRQPGRSRLAGQDAQGHRGDRRRSGQRSLHPYLDDRMDASRRQYRRAVVKRAENVDIRVAFHPERLPRGVWWAVWDGVDGDVIAEEPAGLDSQHSVHRFMRSLERTVAGFHWVW